MPRATDARKAQRLNRARALLRRSSSRAIAVRRLAQACALSLRQAYRYVGQAQSLRGPVPVADAKVAFTVKLSRTLVRRLRSYADRTRSTLSMTVTQALMTMLDQGRRRG